MPKIKTRRKTPTPRVLSLQQQSLLCDTLRQAGNLRDSTLILLILKTGLKSAEVCKLNIADVFRDGQVIATLTVRPEMATNGIPRRLPLSGNVQNAIEAFIRWKGQAGESLQPSAPLFCTARTKKRLIPRDFQRLLKNACAALGHQFTPNDLRHTFATELYQKTGDLESVRVALGLRSLKPEQVAMYTRSSESGAPKVSLPHGEKKSEVEASPPKRGVWRTYDGAHGLPGRVLCLQQDRDGYLWLGTGAGLYRYDGTEFTRYTTGDEMADRNVRVIHEDRHGRLWFGIGVLDVPERSGGGVFCYDGQEFIAYTTDDGLAHHGVLAICEDCDGRLWFGTKGGGVSCFDGQEFTNYTTADGLAHNEVLDIYEDQRGHLWFVFCWLEVGVSHFDGREFTTYTAADGVVSNRVMAICEDHHGRLWFGADGGVSCFDGREFTTYTTVDGLGQNNVVVACADSRDRLWFGFGFGGGVSCFDGLNFTTYTIADGLLDDRVVNILEDRDGNMWFSHLHSGLTHLELEALQFLTNAPVSSALCQDSHGALWFGNGTALCSLKDGKLHRRFLDKPVHKLLKDSRGAFWVAVWWQGLYCYDSSDTVWDDEGTHFTMENGLGSNHIEAWLETRDGTMWAGTMNPGCLCRFDGNGFEAIPTPHPTVSQLFEDSRGRIWMGGLKGGGLSCYDGGKLVTYTVEDGLSDDSITSIVEDDVGNLWIGTREELNCFDGSQFTRYGKAEGLFSLQHECSVKDARGHLWFSTLFGGLYRYNGIHFQWLTIEDGLPSNSITGLISCSDGSMIIGTLRGIVRYHPTAVLPAPVAIREVVANQVYRNPTELELTTTEADLLTISYHGLSLTTRRMRYSYILEGYDKDWQDTWERSVRYENLPAGQYTFKVIAINRDLVESETPAQLSLTIVPDPRDLEITTLRTEVTHLRREVSGKYDFSNLIGRSVAIKQVHLLMERAIDSGLNVLITGETGTGKELVANGIHYNSARGNQTPVTCDCGALSKDLARSELFGHRKGAFTDAHENKIGLFEAADGNTLILDEIGNMPLDVQQNLLRVLEERKIQRLGETTTRDIDVRVIAITNLDLEKETEVGRFREDLYYRLNEFPIPLPPLRERREDIPLLAEYFLREIDKDIDGFAPGVFEMLQSYNWPGNVRQLQKAIRLAAAFAEQGGRLEIHHFAWQISQGESLIQEVMNDIGQKSTGYRELVNQFERRCIEQALTACNGNRTQLIRRMKDLNIE